MRKKCLMIAALVSIAQGAHAQTDDDPGGDVDFTVEAAIERDDNVFHLTEKQIEKLEAGGSGNRYDDMESPSDLIIGLGARLDLEMKALAGRKTTLRIEPEAAVHLQNSRCSHAGIRASLIQKLWKHGEASVRVETTPSRFKRNYFSGGTDEDGDGDVSGSEKVYRPGIVTDTRIEAAVESRISKPLSIRVAAGTSQETWKAPLRNRDERAVFAGAGLDSDLGKRLHLGIEYEFLSAQAGAGAETVLNDGVPLSTRVDRSYVSHEVSPGFRLELSKRLDLLAGASLRQRTYASARDADPYRGRSDRRAGVGGGLRFSTKRLRLEAEYAYRVSSTNRPNDPDRDEGDELDYESNVVHAGLTMSF